MREQWQQEQQAAQRQGAAGAFHENPFTSGCKQAICLAAGIAAACIMK